MCASSLCDLEGVSKTDDNSFMCIDPQTAIAVIERILRITKNAQRLEKIDVRIVTSRWVQSSLYKFADRVGEDGYHGFYESLNWESACSSIYDTFGVDARFIFQLYARVRRISFIFDGEMIGGWDRDGIECKNSRINVSSVDGGLRVSLA